MKISLFSKDLDSCFSIIEQIKQEAFKREIEIDDNEPDIIIFIGGDGTFLKAIQNNIDRLDNVLFLGIKNKKNSLGYFYDFDVEDVEDIFDLLDTGLLKINRANLLKGLAYSNKEELEFYAFNEIRLSNMLETLRCQIFINDELFEKYAGDELIISTPNGTTGLNKSAGGAIIFPDLNTIEITPLANVNSKIFHTLSNPIIIPNNVVIKIDNINQGGLVSFDYVTLDNHIETLEISRSNLYVSYLTKNNISFIKRLKDKFDI